MFLKQIRKTPRLLRKIPERRFAQLMRWALIFGLGWYAAECTHKAPEAVEAVQNSFDQK